MLTFFFFFFIPKNYNLFSYKNISSDTVDDPCFVLIMYSIYRSKTRATQKYFHFNKSIEKSNKIVIYNISCHIS